MPQVTLRDLTEADRERLHAWRNSPDVAAFMYTDHQISRAEHDRWFDGLAGDPRRRYWMIDWDGEPVGLANLADIDRHNGRCSLGHYLAEPAARGQGIGAFVEYWLIEQVFGALGLNKFWCEVLASNQAAWKLHLSFGFQREAVFREHVRKNGLYEDVFGLGLLASDWPALKPAMLARLHAKGFSVA
jgi:UDP-4-amino-4,6-dideoxy-N-acetyl-beta-L-altrosamine N-acetyltransferase